MASLREFLDKSKRGGESFTDSKIFIVVLIILIAFASYGLGRLSKIEEGRPPVKIIQPTAAAAIGATNPSTSGVDTFSNPPAGGYVASISGTKYHFPWCPGAQNMKEENKIYFATKEEAERAGYSPASNCKGL